MADDRNIPFEAVTSPERRKSRGLVFWLRIGIAFVVFCCFAVWMAGQISRMRLNRRLDALAAKGIPIGNKTLSDKYFKTSSRRDPTGLWVAAFRVLDSKEFVDASRGVPQFSSDEQARMVLPGEPWPHEQAVRDLLNKYASTVEKLHRAGEIGGPARFPVTFDSIRTLLPDVQRARSAARLLTLELHLAIRDRNATQVADTLRCILALADSMSNEPCLVGQLVRCAIHAMAIEGLRTALAADAISVDELRTVREAMQRFNDFCSPFRCAIQGERAMGLEVLANPELTGIPRLLVWLSNRTRQTNVYLDFMQQVEDGADGELSTFLSRQKKIAADMHATLRSNAVGHLSLPVLNEIMVANASAANALARTVSKNRLAQTAISLKEYFANHRRWPEKLEELAATGLSLESTKAANDLPMGYLVQGKHTWVWAFDPDLDTSVAVDPPGFVADGAADSSVPTEFSPSDTRRLEMVWKLSAPR